MTVRFLCVRAWPLISPLRVSSKGSPNHLAQGLHSLTDTWCHWKELDDSWFSFTATVYNLLLLNYVLNEVPLVNCLESLVSEGFFLLIFFHFFFLGGGEQGFGRYGDVLLRRREI